MDYRYLMMKKNDHLRIKILQLKDFVLNKFYWVLNNDGLAKEKKTKWVVT